MKAIEFLESAKTSIEIGNEVDVRNAMSRAYYCAYHIALEIGQYIPDHAGMKNGGSHIRLISKLTECHCVENLDKSVMRQLKEIGLKLKRARNKRNMADYQLDNELLTRHYATNQIAEVEIILELLESVAKIIKK